MNTLFYLVTSGRIKKPAAWLKKVASSSWYTTALNGALRYWISKDHGNFRTQTLQEYWTENNEEDAYVNQCECSVTDKALRFDPIWKQQIVLTTLLFFRFHKTVLLADLLHELVPPVRNFDPLVHLKEIHAEPPEYDADNLHPWACRILDLELNPYLERNIEEPKALKLNTQLDQRATLMRSMCFVALQDTSLTENEREFLQHLTYQINDAEHILRFVPD
ncbi:hypothetical protein COB21_02280 [Candidatus Aerophobetes bacterium]|uniref:Uncharacterized protein n=1 Tax=Aerophobetes bacterium TaxID=2030807 RepID=A0A2A4X5M8_UNCAE|nr:MAG: hypothetical protein COB21_02280 [Candidatus Aerophobetes bacterium]